MSTARKQKAGTPYREMKMGQGLGALFGELPLEPSSEKSIAVGEISLPPQQPRRYFDPQAMESLVSSIRRDGVLEPLLVRQLESGGYELVAGERRYRASKEIGLEIVPVVIRQMSDEQALHVASKIYFEKISIPLRKQKESCNSCLCVFSLILTQLYRFYIECRMMCKE
jgi:ParB-like nuclease domain